MINEAAIARFDSLPRFFCINNAVLLYEFESDKIQTGSAEGAGEESRASPHWSRKYNLKARKLTSTPRTKLSIKWRRYGVCGFQSPQTQ